MGKIFYIMGKSSSGKDTIYRRLLEDRELALRNMRPRERLLNPELTRQSTAPGFILLLTMDRFSWNRGIIWESVLWNPIST